MNKLKCFTVTVKADVYSNACKTLVMHEMMHDISHSCIDA